ncbi:hypothetical protein B0T17DRAFT_502371 [Bombardia bombarda]|uniref:Uncharacterized protein n=1 Tax=Bombardia bombarda TaxID=252184 RepID=A0AA39XIQ2_9PEZI|nr:hypothetical protein B0T17DRAFT_502371 [Bombardia bombarda]
MDIVSSVGASIAKTCIYVAATLGLYTEDAICIIAACGLTLRPILARILLPASESVMSLLRFSTPAATSNKGSSGSGSGVDSRSHDHNPSSFVKMPESAEQLHHPGPFVHRNGGDDGSPMSSKGLRNERNDGMTGGHYEMEFYPDVQGARGGAGPGDRV